MQPGAVGIRLVGSSGWLVPPPGWLLQLVGSSSSLAPPACVHLVGFSTWFACLVGSLWLVRPSCWLLVGGLSVLLALVCVGSHTCEHSCACVRVRVTMRVSVGVPVPVAMAL